MPAVSVLMAFHRVTPFLRPAVRSVLDQSLRDLELVLVDNGTGQGLAALGEEGADPRIRLIRHETNLGITAAHNAAVAASRGEFIALLDYDDLALPTRLEKQLAALRADPRLGLVGCHALSIDATGAVTGPQFTLAGAEEQKIFSAYTMPAVTPGYTGRREVFARWPYRAEFPFAGDYDLLARAAEHWTVRALPEVLLHYRVHGAQTTATGNASQVLSACMIRLLTARRRAGRPEDLPGLAAELHAWLASPPPAAAAYAFFAERCRREGFPLLAVFHARRVLSLRRTPRTVTQAVGIVGTALAAAPAESVRLLRMAATGPVRAHGLRPL